MTAEKKILVCGCLAVPLQINKYKIYKPAKKSQVFRDVFEHELESETDNFDTAYLIQRCLIQLTRMRFCKLNNFHLRDFLGRVQHNVLGFETKIILKIQRIVQSFPKNSQSGSN